MDDLFGQITVNKKQVTEWSDGMLYPILHRLQDHGCVESHWRVAAWRAALIATGDVGQEDADELESHLLDEIDARPRCPSSTRCCLPSAPLPSAR
jgi:DNA-binding PadR family transcriptional regulator